MPLEWVPPFFVVTTAAQEAWFGIPSESLSRVDLLSDSNAFRELVTEHASRDGLVIVRSSAIRETLDERGRFESHRTVADPEVVWGAIEKIWRSAQESSMAGVVQTYVKPLLAGHLSNERRISRTENDWTFEYGNDVGSFTLRSPSFEDVVEQQLQCTTADDIPHALRRLAAYSLKWSCRIHYEWVWDGSQLFVVQADREDIKIGAPPKDQWPYDPPSEKLGGLVVLRELSEVTSEWKKLATSRLMRELGLPSVPQYVLDAPSELQSLARGKRSAELESDLEILLRWPVVIRTDKKAQFELVLPRTDTIRTVEDAFTFLMTVAKEYSSGGAGYNEFAFILHHFNASRASALALAKPGEPRVRIDSTWGVPEGLRYYPHDSFEVTCAGLDMTENEDAEIQEHIRCKTHYMDIAASGEWVTVPGGPPLDWTPSLPDDAIREIGTYARRVAERIQNTVQVMFFVGIDSADGSVLPWIYTKEEHAGYDSASLRLSGHRVYVATPDDLSQLESRIPSDTTLARCTIVVRPHPTTVRSNEFLQGVAAFARTHNLAVELEGSVLSHNYYVLKRAGARIRAVDPFDPKPVVQRFGKLVRDEIPNKIERHGERAQTTRASRSQLLTLLRAKAVEEALELQTAVSNDDSLEELADLFEVIRSLAANLDLSVDEVIQAADEKRTKRGGFEQGVVLHETRERPLLEPAPAEPRRRGKSPGPRKPRIDNGTISIPLVPPARTEAGIHTRLGLHDVGVDVIVDYDEKDVRVSVRPRHQPPVQEVTEQLALFGRKQTTND
jgi:predicted house-cleaning noncanonical NTP pyrophosphatase (MazG superfamily)